MCSLMSSSASASVICFFSDIHSKPIPRNCTAFECLPISVLQKGGGGVIKWKGLSQQQLTCHAAFGSPGHAKCRWTKYRAKQGIQDAWLPNPCFVESLSCRGSQNKCFSAFFKPNKVSNKKTKLSKHFTASYGRLLQHVGGGQVQHPPKQAQNLHSHSFTLKEFGTELIKIFRFLIPQN